MVVYSMTDISRAWAFGESLAGGIWNMGVDHSDGPLWHIAKAGYGCVSEWTTASSKNCRTNRKLAIGITPDDGTALSLIHFRRDVHLLCACPDRGVTEHSGGRRTAVWSLSTISAQSIRIRIGDTPLS
jgi:hypothetical protein